LGKEEKKKKKGKRRGIVSWSSAAAYSVWRYTPDPYYVVSDHFNVRPSPRRKKRKRGKKKGGKEGMQDDAPKSIHPSTIPVHRSFLAHRIICHILTLHLCQNSYQKEKKKKKEKKKEGGEKRK